MFRSFGTTIVLLVATSSSLAAQPDADDLIARGLELRRTAKPGEAAWSALLPSALPFPEIKAPSGSDTD